MKQAEQELKKAESNKTVELYFDQNAQKEITNQSSVKDFKKRKNYWMADQKKGFVTMEIHFDGPCIQMGRGEMLHIKCLESIEKPAAPDTAKLLGLRQYRSDTESESDAESIDPSQHDSSEWEEQLLPAPLEDAADAEEDAYSLDEGESDGSTDGVSLALTPGTTTCKGEHLRYDWHGFNLNELFTTSSGSRELFGLSIICGREEHCHCKGYKCARTITFGAGHRSQDSCEIALKRWIVRGYSLTNDCKDEHMSGKGSRTTQALLDMPLSIDEKSAALNSGAFPPNALDDL